MHGSADCPGRRGRDVPAGLAPARHHPEGQGTSQLYTVARNVINNERRVRIRRTRLEEKLLAQPPKADPDLAQDVVERLHARQLLDSLPAKDREALQLVEWEHLDLDAAARAAGCSAVTFRGRLHRARRRLVAADEATWREHTAHVPKLITDEALS